MFKQNFWIELSLVNLLLSTDFCLKPKIGFYIHFSFWTLEKIQVLHLLWMTVNKTLNACWMLIEFCFEFSKQFHSTISFVDRTPSKMAPFLKCSCGEWKLMRSSQINSSGNDDIEFEMCSNKIECLIKLLFILLCYYEVNIIYIFRFLIIMHLLSPCKTLLLFQSWRPGQITVVIW